MIDKTLLTVLKEIGKEFDRINISDDTITFWGNRNGKDIEGFEVETSLNYMFYTKVFDGYKIILSERKK